MQRVTGIGGIFFKARDPEAMCAWYKTHLGIDVLPWGGAVFNWHDANGQPTGGSTIWSISAKEGADDPAPFTINYRVADLDALLAALRDEGCTLVGEPQDGEYGKFGWVLDLEGNKVELWQPPPGQ